VRNAVALPPISAENGRPSRDREARPADAELARKVAAEFRAADRNADDYLSRDEVHGRFNFIDRQFDRVDTDGDGQISPLEFQHLRSRQAQTLHVKP
jgi:hypothetical protein